MVSLVAMLVQIASQFRGFRRGWFVIPDGWGSTGFAVRSEEAILWLTAAAMEEKRLENGRRGQQKIALP